MFGIYLWFEITRVGSRATAAFRRAAGADKSSTDQQQTNNGGHLFHVLGIMLAN